MLPSCQLHFQPGQEGASFLLVCIAVITLVLGMQGGLALPTLRNEALLQASRPPGLQAFAAFFPKSLLRSA